MHFFSCARVRELQLCRVQALINLVAQEWVPYVRKVDAYLVCSARFEDTFNVRRAREIFHNFNVSDGIFGIFLCYRHFFSVYGASADGKIERHVFVDPADGDGVVGRDLQKQLIKEGRIHAVEIFNSIEWYPKVLDWFDEYKLPMMANSDIHETSRFAYGDQIRPMTLVFAKEYTLESLREAMFAGRIVAFFDGKLAGDEKYLSQLVGESLKVQVVDAKKGVLVVTNVSDIPFYTLFGERTLPFIFHPRAAVRVTVPKGTVLDFTNCYVGRKTLKKEIW